MEQHQNFVMTAIVAPFLCAVLSAAPARFALLAPRFSAGVAPLALLFLLLVLPVDDARADFGHSGTYPLFCAAGIDGDLTLVVHLLGSAHKIDVNARKRNFRCGSSRYSHISTSLHEAAYFGRSTIAATIAATLIAAGAEVNAKDDFGDTPLHRAASSSYGSDAFIASFVSVLLAAGAEIDARDYGDNTPLHEAVKVRDGAFRVSVLLSSGADVNARNSRGNTPLRETISNQINRMAVRSILIEAGGHWGSACSGLRTVNPAGPTPSCLCEHPNVEALGYCRAPSVENCRKLTPPEYYDSKAGKCVRFVNCHSTAMRKADNSGCECPAGSYAHGNPANAECYADHAPLFHVLDGWLDFIQADNPTLVAHYIADHGQDPDGDYELHSAADNGYHLAAKALIEGGADVDLRRSGETPLHRATRSGKTEMITLLLNRGANANIANDDGETPLHLAARKTDTPENAALVSFLLDKGADPNIFNNSRWRPLDLADGRDGYPRRRKIMSALIAGEANWSDECVGGKVPNKFTPPKCKCPAHLSIDNNGLCECPGHSHSQVNGLCLPKDSAQVEGEIAKMQVELSRLRAALVSLNARISLSAEMPREMVEGIAEQARETAAEIDWRRANFIALGRTSEAGAAPPPVALSDTAAECRMRGGEVRIDSGSGTRICLGLDQSGTFCLVDSGDAFPCRGLFKHVRVCNDIYHRPALNPFICAARCDADETARGKDCE